MIKQLTAIVLAVVAAVSVARAQDSAQFVPSRIAELQDVDLTGNAPGKLLGWNGTNFVAVDANGMYQPKDPNLTRLAGIVTTDYGAGSLAMIDAPSFRAYIHALADNTTTSAIAEGSNLYFTSGRAIASAIIGYVSAAGTISPADSIVTAIGKLNGNIATKQNAITTGTTLQYLRGDLSLATFPTDNIAFTNGAGYITSSALTPYLTSSSAASTYQPLDGDLTAIAALAGTNTLYYRSAANTWSAVTIGGNLSFVSGTLNAVSNGTVTSSSVVTANGVSATVANASTTPAFTFTLGAITPASVNGLTLTANSVGFSESGGTTSKTLTIANTLTFAGNDGSTLNIAAGGTLGSAAFTASTAYDAAGAAAAITKSSLGATTVGGNLFSLANPGAIAFLRLNADNSVSALDAATFRGAIGAGTSSTTGTVTNVTVTPANGVSASVANQGTTPAFTFTLSAITPASVASAGPVSGTTGTFSGAVATGDLTVNGGAAIKKVLRGSYVIDCPNVGATAAYGFAETLTGVGPNDVLVVTPSTYYGTWSAYYTGTNSITVNFYNVSGAAVDPPSTTFYVTALQF